jgi:tetratricopeptide (TPR) repeat protein
MKACTRLMLSVVVSGLLAVHCSAQRELPRRDQPDEQSTILWRITWESDHTQKLALLEEFAARFPKDEAIGWVYEQTYSLLVDNHQIDRAMAIGEKLLALDPDDVELAYRALKMAQEKKDSALTVRWSRAAAAAARRVLAAPQDTDTGQRRLAMAPQVVVYTAYLSYTDILETANPSKLEMMDQFLQQGASPYTPAVERLYLASWREIDAQKAVGIAEKMIEKDFNNEDALILVAEAYMQRDKEPEKAMTYAARVIALMDQPKPEATSDAEWSGKKAVLTGRAHWLIGSLAMQHSKYPQADKSIRLALPYLRSDLRLNSAALFYLGWANYKIGNIPDAIRFSQDCAKTRGPFQEQAAKNLAVIRAENPGRP